MPSKFFPPLPKSKLNRDDLVKWLGGQTIPFLKITDVSIGTAEIEDGSITNAKIEDATIEAAKIASLNADDITAGTLSADRISAGSLDGDKITAGTLDADRITVGTITAERYVLGSPDNLIQNPGFEGDTIDGALDPHAYDAGGGTWSTETTNVRSGARAARYDIDSQSGSAYLRLNGAVTNTNAHPSAAEGDEFYAEGYVRYIDGNPGAVVDLRLSWRDEAGTEISVVNGTNPTLTTSYQKFTIEGTAPAGTAYVAIYVRVVTGGSGTDALLFEDFYARRKVQSDVLTGEAVAPFVDFVTAQNAPGTTLTGSYQTIASASFVPDSSWNTYKMGAMGGVSIDGNHIDNQVQVRMVIDASNGTAGDVAIGVLDQTLGGAHTSTGESGTITVKLEAKRSDAGTAPTAEYAWFMATAIRET